MNDRIDDAIAATSATTVEMAQVPVQIASTGRPAMMVVPTDLSDAEIIELAAFVLLGLRPFIQANAGRSTGILDALGSPIRVS